MAGETLNPFLYPRWEHDDGQWLFLQGSVIVGEVYEMDGGAIKWHCKTSDWRDTNAKTIEQAKAECEASFWKEEWQKLKNP
jgi:hypothetical protein